MKSHTNTHRSGPGAAHIGFSMFGARGPLMSPEGDGNSAGGSGGSSEGTTTEANTTAGTTAPPGGGGEKLLTQAQVNALVAQARREGRESATQQQQTTQQTNQQQQTTTQQRTTAAAPNEPQLMTAEAVQQMMQRERAFTRATATLALNESQLGIMESALSVANPQNVTEWCVDFATRAGWASGSNTNTNTNSSTQQNTQTTGAAAARVPNQVDALSSGGLVDIWNLSSDQIDSLGPEGLRAEHEKILAHANKRSGAPPVPRAMQQTRK